MRQQFYVRYRVAGNTDEIAVPAGRGARRKARRLARAQPGVYAIVVARSGKAQYQAVWTRLGYLTYVFDHSAGPGKPQRCRRYPDQFDYNQRPVSHKRLR